MVRTRNRPLGGAKDHKKYYHAIDWPTIDFFQGSIRTFCVSIIVEKLKQVFVPAEEILRKLFWGRNGKNDPKIFSGQIQTQKANPYTFRRRQHQATGATSDLWARGRKHIKTRKSSWLKQHEVCHRSDEWRHLSIDLDKICQQRRSFCRGARLRDVTSSEK